MSLEQVESALLEALASDSDRRQEVLERLIASLLAESLGFGDRATDGLAVLREEATAKSYFAVGQLWLIDQSSHPVCVDLSIGEGRFVGGFVCAGDAVFSRRSEVTSKLANALQAYPRETVATVSWAFRFERGSDEGHMKPAPASDY